jgi:hypothetical protein
MNKLMRHTFILRKLLATSVVSHALIVNVFDGDCGTCIEVTTSETPRELQPHIYLIHLSLLATLFEIFCRSVLQLCSLRIKRTQPHTLLHLYSVATPPVTMAELTTTKLNAESHLLLVRDSHLVFSLF